MPKTNVAFWREIKFDWIPRDEILTGDLSRFTSSMFESGVDVGVKPEQVVRSQQLTAS
ncbi:MAG: hypothetical protein ACKVHE_28350 [Planctomycetales bacterium]